MIQYNQEEVSKEDWLRLLEKAIDNIPETVTAIASLVTALTVARQKKSVNQTPAKEKGKR